MTEQMELLNKIIEQNMWNVFLPTFLKIVIAALVPAIIGLIVLATIKNMPLPKGIKLIVGIFVRIIAVIAIIISTTAAIKNIELPQMPVLTESGGNPLSVPEITGGGEPPFSIPKFTD